MGSNVPLCRHLCNIGDECGKRIARKLGFTDNDHELPTTDERLGTRFTIRYVEEMVGIRLHRQHRTNSFLLSHMYSAMGKERRPWNTKIP